MYDLIQNFPVKFPDPVKHKIVMSEELKDIITKLLDKNNKTRLGSTNDVTEIINHPWFADIDITAIIDKRVKPDYVPTIMGDEDTSQFDQSFTDMSIDPSLIPQKNLDLINKRKQDFDKFNS